MDHQFWLLQLEQSIYFREQQFRHFELEHPIRLSWITFESFAERTIHITFIDHQFTARTIHTNFMDYQYRLLQLEYSILLLRITTSDIYTWKNPYYFYGVLAHTFTARSIHATFREQRFRILQLEQSTLHSVLNLQSILFTWITSWNSNS